MTEHVLPRVLVLATIFSALVGTASAGTTPGDAKRLEERRSRGLSAALIAAVEQGEPRACGVPDQELQEITAMRISAGGMLDGVSGSVDASGKLRPRTETYRAYFLVIHACHSGSTKVGSWVAPKRSAIWRVSYEQEVDPTAKQPSTPPLKKLKIERIDALKLPQLDP